MEEINGKANVMDIIRDGFENALVSKPNSDNADKFAEAIMSLYEEYYEAYYSTEWERLDDNAKLYRGDHWSGMEETAGLSISDPNKPRPVTPILTSTVENIKADLSDEYPEAVITPDATTEEGVVLAKVLTPYIRQELEICGFERDYDDITQDLVQDGWACMEIGWDPLLNNGIGGSFIRYIMNKNFMCDPLVSDIQNGRACFKIDKLPKDYFKQHYPDLYPDMNGDGDMKLDDSFDNFNATNKTTKQGNSFRFLEAWFRFYDPDTDSYKIHFATVAGHKVLENSAVDYPNGYYRHGMYPFELARLYRQKGSALGIGVMDLFKDAQRYSDKLDGILMENALRASRPRLAINPDMVDVDEARDFSKEVIEVNNGMIGQACQWFETSPLPSYIMNYIQLIRDGIKQESGANDQSRGQTGGGVTAASAITALQEASTKRSRLEARALHYAFKRAVSMQIAVLRDKADVTRTICVTLGGNMVPLPFDKRSLVLLTDGVETPIDFLVSIKTARQTKYSKMSHNELWLQMMGYLRDSADPTIMLEGLDFDEKEHLLDCVRRAQNGGMLNLQKQMQQLMQLVQKQQEELAVYKEVASKAQAAMDADARLKRQEAQQSNSSPIQSQPSNYAPLTTSNGGSRSTDNSINAKAMANAMQ
jgi:hypothetical protein